MSRRKDMTSPGESEENSQGQNINVEVEVPTKNFSTWQSATLFSSIQILYKPSELTDESITLPFQNVKVTIPIDFRTLSRLELDLNLDNPNPKRLKRILTHYFERCDAKVKSIEIPDILWQGHSSHG
jgi:hypothetical protein